MTAPLRASDPITVNVALGDRAYDIAIGRGLLATLGERIAKLRPGCKVAIITDATVAKHHLAATEASLTAAGIASSSVKVPAGVDSGDRIRLAGEGEAGPAGAPPGDLYVEVRVREHAIFQRDGDDLHCEVPIRIAQAALGDAVRVPTLDGEAEIRIPAETQTGKVFRLRDKGVKIQSLSDGIDPATSTGRLMLNMLAISPILCFGKRFFTMFRCQPSS